MALKIGELFATLNLATGDFNKGLKGAQALFKKAGLAIADMGLGAAESMVEIGRSFESAMSDVQAISGASGEELKKLRDTAKEYGSTTAFTATESAEALKYMALAGWDANQSMEALPGVLNMAAASGMDLAAASDAVTDYISAFGLEAKDATYMADAMAKAQATANTSAQQLAEAWGNSAASMHAAGQDMETTTAALMVFADQGMKGSEAGTALSAMMRDITQNMEKGAIKIGNTAIAVQDAQGNFRDLNDIISDVAAATEGMGNAEKSAALMTTFTARSIKGVNMLLNAGVSELNEYESAVRGSAGTASEQAATMLDNLSGDIKLFESALEGVQIDMYESADGILRDAVQGATDIVTAFQQVVQSGFSTDALGEMFETAFDVVGNIGDRVLEGLTKGAQAFVRLLPTISRYLGSGLKRLMAGAKKELPGLMKGLFKVLPGIIKGGLNGVLPELADTAFELIGDLAANIVVMLPDLVPILLKGLYNLATKLIGSAGKVVQGIAKGVLNAFGKGFDSEDLLEAFLANVDQDYMADVKGEIDGEFEYEPAIAAAEAALDTVKTALSELSLDDATAAAIEEAVRTGSGIKLFEQTLIGLGTDSKAAGEAAAAIEDAMGKINGALSGLGLDEAAKNKISELIASGGTKDQIQAALESFGVDKTKAEKIATDITTAQKNLNNSLRDLGIDPAVASQLTSGIGSNKDLIRSCLEALKIPEGVIDTVMASYDTVASDISGKLGSVFTAIYDTLTDGKKDTPEIVKALEDEIKGVYAEAVKNVNKWREEELAKLDKNAPTYEEDSQAIIDKATEMVDTLGTQEQAALSFLTSMTNASADIVAENKGQLDQILADTRAVVAELQSMTETSSLEFKAFEMVTTGVSSNSRTVGKALDYAYATLLETQTKAQEKYEAEIDKAIKEGRDSDPLSAEWDAVKDNARRTYEAQLAQIFQGIASATIDPKDLAEIQAKVEDYNLFGNIGEWLTSGADMGKAPEGLETALRDYLEQWGTLDDDVWAGIWADIQKNGLGEYEQGFREYVGPLVQQVTDALTNAFADGDFDTTELSSAIQSAIDKGLFEGTSFENLDASNIQEFFTLLFGIDTEYEYDTSELESKGDEAVTEVTEAAEEAVETAAAATPSGGTSITTAVDPEITVNEPTVTTGDESSIQEAAEAYLESQHLKIPIGAEVSLNVSVEDSNAASIGTAAGIELGEALAAGIETTIDQAGTAAGKLANAAWAAISGLTSKAKSSGMYFATGFAQGIRNGTNSVANAARSLAKTAVEELQAGIKQGSPSKITMESGAFFGEGFGLGILKELKFVRGAASVIADTALASLSALKAPETGFAAQLSSTGDSVALRANGDFSRLYGALEGIAAQNRPQPIDYDRLADAMAQRPVALYENGRLRARIQARDNSRAQNNLDRRINLSVGK